MSRDQSLFNQSFSVRDAAMQKRKKARAQVNIAADIMLDGRDEKIPCTLTDIGTGGLSLLCKATLYSGDRVNVFFKLKGTGLNLKGTVARSSGKSIGVQFVQITEEELEVIQSYIHSTFFDKDKNKKS